MDGRAYWAEPRWQRWGRNLLLTLGLASVMGYLLGWLSLLGAWAISGRIFSGTEGAVLMRSFRALPSLLAAVLTGLVAPYFLTYRRAALALLAVGSAWGVSCYIRGRYLRLPGSWEVAADVAHSALVPLVLVGVYLLQRWRLGR